MFVHAKRLFKDGKEHSYWSVVENVRNRDGRVGQRQVSGRLRLLRGTITSSLLIL